MSEPVRIQRKRTKGFNLQAESIARNGLPCVYVGRPSRWGNPFKPVCNGEYHLKRCLRAFQALLALDYGWFKRTGEFPWTAGAIFSWSLQTQADVDELLEPLRGKNLACWCSEDSLCHADILLALVREKESITAALGANTPGR